MSWSRRQFDLRDFDPHLQGPYGQQVAQQRARHAQREAFEQGALGDGAQQTRKYVRPFGELYHYVEHPKQPGRQVLVASTFPGTFTPGQNVQVGVDQHGEVIQGHPPQGARNASQTPTKTRSGELDLLSVTGGTPFEVTRGSTTAVTLEGFGFRESPVDTFEPRVYDPTDEDADADGFAPTDEVTFGSITWVSATQVSMVVTVDSTLPDGTPVFVYYARS